MRSVTFLLLFLMLAQPVYAVTLEVDVPTAKAEELVDKLTEGADDAPVTNVEKKAWLEKAIFNWLREIYQGQVVENSEADVFRSKVTTRTDAEFGAQK